MLPHEAEDKEEGRMKREKGGRDKGERESKRKRQMEIRERGKGKESGEEVYRGDE